VVNSRRVRRLGAPARERCVSSQRWGFLSPQAKQPVMQFHIEITCDAAGVSIKVIYRTVVDEMTPFRAKTKAGALLNLYAGRGANGARVLDQKNNELFKL
jgi:hypothetical protein